MTPRQFWKLLRMFPGVILATTRVAAADPLLAGKLGRIIRHSGTCMARCPEHCGDCMTRKLSAMQGYQASRRQRALLMVATEPIRHALRRP